MLWLSCRRKDKQNIHILSDFSFYLCKVYKRVHRGDHKFHQDLRCRALNRAEFLTNI